ncbi:MAG: DUF3015 family protein [Pseudomonadota bacterium]
MVFRMAASAAVALGALCFSQAVAQEDDINPWQDCGIGAMVFPERPVGAAISNIIWDLGSTAVTSKLSSPDTCEGERVKAALFIQRTYAELAVETAKGRGDHLTALAGLYGCDAAVQSALIADVRGAMASTAAAPDFAELDRSAKAERYFLDFDAAVSTSYSGRCAASV